MPSSLVLGLVMSTVALPAAATALLGAVALLPFAGAGSRRRLTGAVILTVAYLAGYVGVYGWPAFPPNQALDWVPALLLVAVALYGVMDRIGANGVARRGLLLLFVAGATALLMAPLLRYGIGRTSAIDGAAVSLCWLAVALIHDHPGGDDLSFGVLTFLTAVGNAFMAALSGSVMMGQLSGVLASVLATWGVLGVVVQRRRLTRAGRGVVLALLAVLMLIGQIYGGTPLWATVMLLALLGLQRAIGPLVVRVAHRDTPLARTLATLALAGIPITIGLYFIVRANLRPGEF